MCIRSETVCSYKRADTVGRWMVAHYSDVSILRQFILFADWHHIYTC
jgi:hypothetical protein